MRPPLIRRLRTGEAELYRSIRLASLKESPQAFSTSLDSAMARDAQSWRQQADNSASGSDRATFLAIHDNDQPLGLAALYRDAELPNEGELLQMWVSPEFRGTGLAVELLDAVFDWAAANHFRRIRAGITTHNQEVLRFYQRYGFERKATEQGDDAEIIQLERAVE